MKSGKFCLGYKQTLKTLRQGKAKLIILANNTPHLRWAWDCWEVEFPFLLRRHWLEPYGVISVTEKYGFSAGNAMEWSWLLLASVTDTSTWFHCRDYRAVALTILESAQKIRDRVLRHARQDRRPPLQRQQHRVGNSLRSLLPRVHLVDHRCWWLRHHPHLARSPDRQLKSLLCIRILK